MIRNGRRIESTNGYRKLLWDALETVTAKSGTISYITKSKSKWWCLRIENYSNGNSWWGKEKSYCTENDLIIMSRSK